MSTSPPESSAQLNRLRAASALIPIIESGLAEGKLSIERAALMGAFCDWASKVTPEDSDHVRSVGQIGEGLERLKAKYPNLE